MSAVFVGVDLGREQDYTAVAVLVADPPPAAGVAEAGPLFQPAAGGRAFRLPAAIGSFVRAARGEATVSTMVENGPPAPGGRVYRVRWLQRYPLGTKYGTICDHVAALMWSPQVGAGARLVVDATGVGVAVTDMLEERGLRNFDRVTITGGAKVARDGFAWSVPKRDLVSAVQVLAQNRRLVVSPELPAASTLRRELASFTYKLSDLGHDSYGSWREGSHDDLVLAVALACWRATRAVPIIKAY